VPSMAERIAAARRSGRRRSCRPFRVARSRRRKNASWAVTRRVIEEAVQRGPRCSSTRRAMSSSPNGRMRYTFFASPTIRSASAAGTPNFPSRTAASALEAQSKKRVAHPNRSEGDIARRVRRTPRAPPGPPPRSRVASRHDAFFRRLDRATRNGGMISGDPSDSAAAIRSAIDWHPFVLCRHFGPRQPRPRGDRVSTMSLSDNDHPSASATRSATSDPPDPYMREMVMTGIRSPRRFAVMVRVSSSPRAHAV